MYRNGKKWTYLGQAVLKSRIHITHTHNKPFLIIIPNWSFAAFFTRAINIQRGKMSPT